MRKKRRFERRPWGWFLKIWHSPRFWVKIIRVKKGHRTSQQYHFDRNELHIALPPYPFSDKKTQYFRREKKHRMYPGTYLELAWGKSVRESDIVRINDDYGRRT